MSHKKFLKIRTKTFVLPKPFMPFDMHYFNVVQTSRPKHRFDNHKFRTLNVHLNMYLRIEIISDDCVKNIQNRKARYFVALV